MKSHAKWSEIVEIAREVKTLQADMIITLGGGTLTDGAKIVAFVGDSDKNRAFTVLTRVAGSC